MKHSFITKTFEKPPYFIINIMLAIFFTAIFMYSTIFSAGADNHPIDCYFAQHGLQCPTCGISRGFSEIMRGRIDDALVYNQYSLRLFIFFLLQLIIRTIIILQFKKLNNKTFIIIDIISSTIILIYSFYPILSILIKNSLKLA